MDLVDFLIKDGWLKTPRIIDAFRKIKRKDFMPARIGYAEGVAGGFARPAYGGTGGTEEIKSLAEIDEAMPIGYSQTISQPAVVAFMMERLKPVPGDKILDIGSGSGWTTALLAQIIGPKGKVFAIELIPELKEFGEKNVGKYNFIKKGIAEFICADGSKGYKREAPYDKILVSAAGKKIPAEWKKQVKTRGRIVAPVQSSILVLTKKSPSFAKDATGKEKEFEEKEYPGFAFVPLIQQK